MEFAINIFKKDNTYINIMKLLGNRICVSVEANGERTTKHGFVVPEENKDYYRGEITNVGSNVTNNDIFIGGTIYISRDSSFVKLSKDLFIFNVNDVLAIEN